MVVSSFTLSELGNDKYRSNVIESLWNSTSDVLVLVDRGTPIGYNIIMKARDQIFKLAGNSKLQVHIVAPVASFF